MNQDNLEELLYNDPLMGALARVLQEGAFKSMELATNITHIFYCFARFSGFHETILKHKIGATCMKLIEQVWY
jgi:hypothetical protein